jgi:hypothetical protein
VSENGVISFEEPWTFPYPKEFPSSDIHIQQSLVVAPFWSDNDIRKEGAVRYATYVDSQANAAINPSGKALLDIVNANIQEEESEPMFVGLWMLIAHWDGVHPSPHGSEDNAGFSEDELNRVS